MALIQDAVLALVVREPSHAYAIFQKLRSVSPDPDSMQTSSVYNAFKRLSHDGLIEVFSDDPAYGSGERPRFIAEATDAGRGRVERWLAQPPSSPEELRLRVGLAQPTDDLDVLIKWVVEAIGETQQRLGAAPGRRRDQAAYATGWDAACAMVLSSLEFRELSAHAQWLAEVHAHLKKLHDLALSLRS